MAPNLNTIQYMVIGSIIPTLLWMFLWLRQDRKNPEPWGLLSMAFFIGMASVLVLLPLRNTILSLAQVIGMPGEFALPILEEVIKCGFIIIPFSFLSTTDEPIDWVIYLVMGALGFSAAENALYIATAPFTSSIDLFIMGDLRFLGATVLHSVSAAIVGIMLGFAFYQSWLTKFFAVLAGLALGISLHVFFNSFILEKVAQGMFGTFVIVWVVGGVLLFLLERIKRQKPPQIYYRH